MSDWTDSRKFWWETCRIVVVGFIGAILATVVLGGYADTDKAQRDIRARAIDDFISTSNAYTAKAYDFCGSQHDDVKKEFESSIVDSYHGSRLRMELYFESSRFRPKFALAEEKEDGLFRLCQNGNVPKEKWEPWRKELKNANADIARAALDKNRSVFWYK